MSGANARLRSVAQNRDEGNKGAKSKKEKTKPKSRKTNDDGTKIRLKQTGEMKMDMSGFFGSAYLKVEDIKANGPITVKIVDVSPGRFDKPDLTFDDGTKVGCNTTSGRALARAYGWESIDWINKEVELTAGTIDFQGKPQEAILIRPVTPAIANKAPPKPKPRKDFDDDIPF